MEIIRTCSQEFTFAPLIDKESDAGGEYTNVFKGYFHPLAAPSSNGSPLKVYLVSSAATSMLYMSPNEDPYQKVGPCLCDALAWFLRQFNLLDIHTCFCPL